MMGSVNGKNDGVNEGAPEEDDIFEQDIKHEAELDSVAGEDSVTCPACKGEGITLCANDDDENDKDFDTCSICGGSGKLEEYEGGELGEDEWDRLTEDAKEFGGRD
jgi:DnaJ-class molecular chaperone